MSRVSRIRATVTILLVIQIGLLAFGSYVNSPTYNEPGHLAAGIGCWQFGRFDVYKVNPPLVRLVAAVPVMLTDAEFDWKSFDSSPSARPEMSMGYDLARANGKRFFWLMAIARWACIPWTLLGGCICFCWGSELYGSVAGILSLALWSFCPNILAHGQLITSDAAGAALALAACYSFWRWLKIPTWWRLFTSGAVLGIAELAKTTLIIFLPLWFLLWIVYRMPERKSMTYRRWLCELRMLLICTAVCVYVMNLGYGFEGSCTKLGEYRFVSATLTGIGNDRRGDGTGNRFAGSWLAEAPVPLPSSYVLGIDLQRKDFEMYTHQSYLRGMWKDRGWWYYYLYGLAIKVPLGTWVLAFLAFTLRYWTKPTAKLRDEFVLVAPAVIILAFVSSQLGFSEHFRYVLPVFPFWYVWIGRIATVLKLSGIYCTIPAMIVGLALCWSIGSSLWYYPHSLSYFNELVGGPMGGPRHMLHSNIDWGQDLLNLKVWQDKHAQAKPLNLYYFGHCDPKIAGLDFIPARTICNSDEIQFTPGWYAVSVNYVYGYGDKSFEYFKKLTPVDTAGFSIYIYELPKSDE